ncbi:MAG: universal stress protein [Longimonas sp.]|uniref:universal stress protein n=1 Tax=Longimonas sp. TaxID=2039626 RepID=UPI003350A941
MLDLNHILVPRDFSSTSDRALQYALDWARRTGATLHVVHAKVLHQNIDQETVEAERGTMKQLREQLRHVQGNDMSKGAVDLKEAVVRDVAAAPAILEYTEDHDIDLIVMGTHGRRGMRRMIMGSVAEEVVRYAACPVLTVRGEPVDMADAPDPIQTIGVPVDFSTHSREALLHAAAVADLLDADLFVHHVLEDTLHPAFYVGGVQSVHDIDPDIETKALAKLDRFVEEALQVPAYKDIVVRTRVDVGSAARLISKVAKEEDVDLVAMATHGRTGGTTFRLGSVTEKVVRHTRCPVLTVKVHGRSLLATEEAAADASAADASTP